MLSQRLRYLYSRKIQEALFFLARKITSFYSSYESIIQLAMSLNKKLDSKSCEDHVIRSIEENKALGPWVMSLYCMCMCMWTIHVVQIQCATLTCQRQCSQLIQYSIIPLLYSNDSLKITSHPANGLFSIHFPEVDCHYILTKVLVRSVRLK